MLIYYIQSHTFTLSHTHAHTHTHTHEHTHTHTHMHACMHTRAHTQTHCLCLRYTSRKLVCACYSLPLVHLLSAQFYYSNSGKHHPNYLGRLNWLYRICMYMYMFMHVCSILGNLNNTRDISAHMGTYL